MTERGIGSAIERETGSVKGIVIDVLITVSVMIVPGSTHEGPLLINVTTSQSTTVLLPLVDMIQNLLQTTPCLVIGGFQTLVLHTLRSPPMIVVRVPLISMTAPLALLLMIDLRLLLEVPLLTLAPLLLMFGLHSLTLGLRFLTLAPHLQILSVVLPLSMTVTQGLHLVRIVVVHHYPLMIVPLDPQVLPDQQKPQAPVDLLVKIVVRA